MTFLEALIVIVLMAGSLNWLANLFEKRSADRQERIIKDRQEERLSSDEYVISEITKFENEIVTENPLPDSVCYSDAYVFRYLMKPWFYELMARERYNADKAKKLRLDMLVYMDLLSSSRTESFLAMEGRESEREKRSRTAYEQREQYKMIERAFAELIGGNSKSDLDFARDVSNFGKFSQNGTPAPEGYRYVLNSLVADQSN
jgi:hypothetical protein